MAGDKSYFSVSFDLIIVEDKIPYSLYVNSSALSSKFKFVKVFSKDEILEKSDLENFKTKYERLYISEKERSFYLRSLARSKNVKKEEAAGVIKESAINYLHKIFDTDKEFSTELLSNTINECRDAVESMIDVLDDYNIDSLRGLIANLSAHDFYTYDHSINVSMYCITILRTLKPDAKRTELLHAGLGGLLHDLGKIKIPTQILNSPKGLTEDEYEVIKKHPSFGIDLLRSGECKVSDDIDLISISRVVHEHHENWDGTGYPTGLKEKEIHLLARICTIADFFDAITTKRSYNKVLPISDALQVMRKFSGIKLDPKVFKVFEDHVSHSSAKTTKDLRLKDSFDPTIPYETLPLYEIEELFTKEDFGQIRIIDKNEQKKKKK